MYDLEKLEKRFYEFIKIDKYPDKDEIRITEDLLKRQEALYIPFGEMRYFLVIEDEKPVIYVHGFSRMDVDSICFIDEDGHTDAMTYQWVIIGKYQTGTAEPEEA